MKQTISNACGTIGALHAIANNQDKSTPGVSATALIDRERNLQYANFCTVLSHLKHKLCVFVRPVHTGLVP